MRSTFAIFFMLFSVIIYGQTLINGHAPSYIGERVTLLEYTDGISYTTRELAKSKVDEDGHFYLNLRTKKSVRTIIEVGDKHALLYLDSANQRYFIHFPGITDEGQRFSENLVKLVFDSLPSNDLNTLILEFNYRFDDFLFGDTLRMLAVAEQGQTFRDSLMAFKQQLLNHYDKINNTYFQQYMRYSVAAIEQLSKGDQLARTRLAVWRQYLYQKPILYDNDAYMTFFNQFFEKSLSIPFKNGQEPVIEAVFKKDIGFLENVLKRDALLQDEQLRELVMIKGLSELFYDYNYSQEDVLYLLNHLADSAKYIENKMVATNLLKVFTRLLPGYPAPDFKLLSVKGDTLSLNNFKGKYLYLSFWASWNSASIREIEIMDDLFKEYGKYVQFLSVSVDRDLDGYKDQLHRLGKKKWQFCHFDGDLKLLDDYQVKTLPLYYLIDPDGILIAAPAAAPSPNSLGYSIDKDFFYIRKKVDPHAVRNVGQKEN